MSRILIWILIIGILALGGWWLWQGGSRPLPGEKIEDMGAEHVADISNAQYNSNPPTSGPHFGVWAKKGVYDRVISDGYLIHSMEHGYVIVSYNCGKTNKQSLSSINAKRKTNLVYAHETEEPHIEEGESGNSGSIGGEGSSGKVKIVSGEETIDLTTATVSSQPLTRMNFSAPPGMGWFTPENPPAKEIELPESFNPQECKELVSELSEMTKVAERVIVVPRPQNDSLIALTAWGRIEKLDSFDKKRIENFIKSWHNRGPEKTVE